MILILKKLWSNSHIGFNLLVTTQKRLEGNHEIRVSHAWVTSHDQICSKDAKKTPKCSLVISNQKKEFNSKFSYTAIHYFICLQVLSYFSKTIFFDLNKLSLLCFAFAAEILGTGLSKNYYQFYFCSDSIPKHMFDEILRVSKLNTMWLSISRIIIF